MSRALEPVASSCLQFSKGECPEFCVNGMVLDARVMMAAKYPVEPEVAVNYYAWHELQIKG